jgi:hypothetical protein
MATYQILYWADIPVQVKANEGRNRVSVALTERFQEAVDAAAMVAGLVGSDAYTEQFRWSDAQERAGSPRAVADAVAAELEATYGDVDWRATAEALRSNRAAA